MKKMRKLIPAFAMLMVSAIMLSTASFAWFTTSANVTASGMSVKAQAAGGLVMSAAKVAGTSYSAPGVNDYAATIDLTQAKWYTNGATNIFPTSTDGTQWYKADAVDANSQTADGTTYDDLGATGIEANNTYYLATKLYFKAVVENKNHTLTVTKVEVTDTDANLDASIRVAMKVGSNWFYFAPNYSGTGLTLKHTTYTGDPAAYGTAAYTIGTAPGNISVGETVDVDLVTNLTAATATEVEVYIYYEGEDENCKSAYAVDINTLNIKLSFTATETPAP